MAAILRFRKLCFLEPVKCSTVSVQSFEKPKNDEKQSFEQPQKPESLVSAIERVLEKPKSKKIKKQPKEWRCVDSCCWLIGYLCTSWWLLLFLCNFLPANLPGLRVPEAPGVRLKRDGLTALHPVVLVPGIVTGGLELWEGRPCSEGLFRKRLWGGSFTEIFKRPLCWLEHLSLDNETGLDPPGIRVRAVPGLVAADYFAPAPPLVGGGGGQGWCAKHIKAIMNIGPAFLGVPKAVANILSAEGRDVAFIRSMAPGLLDSETFGFQTLQHIMRVSRTWDSVISLVPRGGETIWGDLNKSPEVENICYTSKARYLQSSSKENNGNDTDAKRSFHVKELPRYGRIISFGKEKLELPSSQLSIIDSKELMRGSASRNSNTSCGEVSSEYDEMSRNNIKKVAESDAYTASSLLDLLRFVAPKMMKRAEAHFSHGIAEDLDDLKYTHYKYWSNPLETKLPDAPDMEIFCSYGVGIPTERSYVYKLSSSDRCKSIPLQIDSSAYGSDNGCLKGGVHFVDGDESVPVVSAGFMCAKGWRGKTRFNPSGISTYIREHQHKAPSSLLEGRGTESGAHVDIMGNVAFIEDVLRIAGGATGAELGGDRIYSDIMKMSERINIRL
ncbi:hypothetical protein RDI58_027461 [Solanum bulbocastanum]|uniref:Phospholipid:diacylglycerol acyltransferase 2 n=1 Tax=Solanum bulbocastanum TaxID=147425 RepID=A0AAN8SXS3_SOLBU